MLKFNTLLEEAGFEPRKVFLLRHQDSRPRTSLYQAWKSKRKDFEAYQSVQSWTHRFPVGFSLAAFVVGPERETLFVGMYDVLSLSRRSGPYTDALVGPLDDQDRSWHELKYSQKMQEYEEKLVIEWGEGYLAWRQRASRHNKIVLEIRAHPKEPPFPRYINFSHRLGELADTYTSWQHHLKVKGVYLLTFDDGMQYVGSATGQEGFLQRWQDYLRTGHGGNMLRVTIGSVARHDDCSNVLSKLYGWCFCLLRHDVAPNVWSRC